MAESLTGYGTVVTLFASSTFPAGLVITQLADDADPLDFAAVQIADTAMGVNGDLVTWARANPLPMTLNVIPGSLDDQNLQILFDANRVGLGKVSANDAITATVVYPDGTQVTMTGGVIVEGMPGRGVASNGRIKTRAYTFSFEQKI